VLKQLVDTHIKHPRPAMGKLNDGPATLHDLRVRGRSSGSCEKIMTESKQEVDPVRP